MVDPVFTTVYSHPMFTLIESGVFKAWFNGLRDPKARARIDARIKRAQGGNLGDWKNVVGPINEMRIDYGPGYRLYFARRGAAVIMLLCGGNKGTQQVDIRQAARILAHFVED